LGFLFYAIFSLLFSFFALFFLCAFALVFASRSRVQNAKKAPGAYLWLLLSLIGTESVHESTEKLPPHVVMTSLAYKTNCREKVISLKVPVFMDNEGSA
jgi:CBS domain containing-hemolysin-like protein